MSRVLIGDSLADARQGDLVLLRSHAPGERIAPVDSVTATIVRVRGIEYRRKDGRERGEVDPWHGRREIAAFKSPEHYATVAAERRRTALAEKLRRVAWVAWDRLPLDQLEAVAAIVFPPAPESSEGQL